MGNWRRAHLVGTCDRGEAGKLRRVIRMDLSVPDFDQPFYPLSATGGVCGLPMWPDEEIDAVGNLAERDYDAEDVADCLRKLLTVAPSLELEVHLGGEYEADECVATVVCRDGEVSVEEPRVDEVPEVPVGQMQENLLRSLLR